MSTTKKSGAAPKSSPVRTKKAAADRKLADTSVAIIGGGIAGLTAAIKLRRAGIGVTLFERGDRLGGNTSSRQVDGVEHDVYPHMFPQWYDNFWELFEGELGLSRAAHFDARPGVLMRNRGANKYRELFNPTTMEAVVENLKSGVLSPAEMLLLGYSTLDLAGSPMNREGYDQLDSLSVNGFLYSSNTSTEPVAEMMNYMLQLIWSIKSEQTAAATYQDFLRHSLSFPDGAPFAHMLKNSLQDGLIAPIEALLTTLGTDIRLSEEITDIRLVDGGTQIYWRKTGSSVKPKTAVFDSVIVAVPSKALCNLVFGDDAQLKGDTIVTREPSLAQTRRLRSLSIPVLDLYLNRNLPGFPVQNIGLAGAKYGLSVVDIAQLWPAENFSGNTALVLAASDGEALPSKTSEGMARAMLEELKAYYPEINIGSHWGDPDCDIDWSKTYFRANADYSLFLNDVGSWEWRPKPCYPETLPGLFFAGDLARSNVDMATVEGAVESGVRAASSSQEYDAKRNGSTMRGKPIGIVKHTTYSNAAFRAAKLALMPAAYAAKAMVDVKALCGEDKPGDLGNALQSEHVALLPLQYVSDWWTSAYWFWRAALSPDDNETPLGPCDHEDDEFIGLGAAMLMVVGEIASYVGDQCEDRWQSNNDKRSEYKRRWRPKR